jgi:hypothetical protein
MLKLLYKPVAIVAGIVGGLLSGLIFKRIWKVVGRGYPAPPSASYGAGTPFHRSPYLPRCTDARRAPQATPPANFSILASAVRRC